MKKYIDADRLKELLDAKYKEFTEKAKKNYHLQYQYMADGLDIAEQFVDSLQQEQPEVDLEKEMSRFIRKYFELPNYKDDFIAEIDWEKSMKECAQYFYKLARHQQNREEWNGEEDTPYWYTSKEQVSKKIEAAQGWVPSENQIEALRQIIEDAPEYYKPRCTLETLYNDLKKYIGADLFYELGLKAKEG